MNTFLLFISFLLNGLTIYAVIVLYTRQNRLAEVEKKQEKMIKEMEELISSYLFEMKEENESFLNKFNRLNKEIPVSSFEKRISGESDSLQLPEMVSKDTREIKTQTINTSNTVRLNAAKAYQSNLVKKPAEKTQINDNNILSEKEAVPEGKTEIGRDAFNGKTEKENLPVSDAEVLIKQAQNLLKQGLTEEEIAKKLNRGKTEIELLLKFHQNKQE